MTTGKTQTVVIDLVIIILTETLKRRHVACFSKTAERITMKLSDFMKDGSLGANIDDAMMSYIIGTPHIYPQNIFSPTFIPLNFFPPISFPKFFSPKIFPQIFDRHFFTCSLFPCSLLL